MEFTHDPNRLAGLSETQRATVVRLKEQWNLSHGVDDAGPELDDEALVKFANHCRYDLTAAKKRVTAFVDLTRRLGGGEGLGSDTHVTEDVAFVLDAGLVYVDRNESHQIVIAVSAQRCLDSFAKHECTAMVVARTLIYVLKKATDDSAFTQGTSIIFDLRGLGMMQAITGMLPFQTIFSPLGVFPVTITKIYVVIPGSSDWLGTSLSQAVHSLFTLTFDFIHETQLPGIWGVTCTPHVPRWLGGKVNDLDEKLNASAFVARLKFKER